MTPSLFHGRTLRPATAETSFTAPIATPTRSALLALCAAGLANACTPPIDEAATFYPPDSPGPYTPSATTFTFTDTRGKMITAEMWYPTDDDCEPFHYPEIPLAGTACRDAKKFGEEWPLVAFSHGFGGIRYQSIFMTEWLASHGYVVVAPDHEFNTMLDLDDDLTAQVALERPGDITATVDAVASAFPGLVDVSRFVMTGHSFGGWTTNVVAGGTPDMQVLADFCAVNDSYDLCNLEIDASAALASGPDARVIAAISMAPAGWYSFSDFEGMAPMLLMGGEKDESESIEAEIQPLYDRLPVPKRMAVLAGAGHYAYTDICLIGPIMDDCEEEAGGFIELDVAHEIVRAQAAAFVAYAYTQDERLLDWLPAGESEVTWTEQLQ